MIVGSRVGESSAAAVRSFEGAMASEWNPDDKQEVPPAGGTMVGIRPLAAPVATPDFGSWSPAGAVPGAAEVPAAGGTMVGIRPIGGALAPAQPAGVPEAGGTMVGIRPVGAAFGASAFGGGVPGAFANQPAAGVPEAGGTMVGIRPVGGAFGGGVPGAFANPQPAGAPEAGGTMVGLTPIGGLGAHAPVMDSPAGGTMVGLSPIGMSAQVAERPVGPPPDYEIVAHVGGDELGQVFHVRERATGNDYALRLFTQEIANTPGVIETMRQVVEMAQAAEHTHLGRLWALDETATPALVLEYVPGKSLHQLLSEKGSAPAAAVIDLGIRLGSAIGVAHNAGLAHGNVHSGNVILEAKTGRWVLLDVAQRYAMNGLDPLDDLYHLGTLLYQMASGHYPFENPDLPIPDPRTYAPKIPPALAALLLRSLQADPSLRFQSASEFVQALARARPA